MPSDTQKTTKYLGAHDPEGLSTAERIASNAQELQDMGHFRSGPRALQAWLICAIDGAVAAERRRCAAVARKHLNHKSQGADCALQIWREIENVE